MSTREPLLNSLTIRLNLTHYGDVKVVVASDRHERTFMGVPADGAEAGTYLFIQIDRSTLLELVRGEVALFTVMTERGVGLVFETSDYEAGTCRPPAAPFEPGIDSRCDPGWALSGEASRSAPEPGGPATV